MHSYYLVCKHDTYNFMLGACCLHLNLTINLPGREGSVFNKFSGEYKVIDEYTDNGKLLNRGRHSDQQNTAVYLLFFIAKKK